MKKVLGLLLVVAATFSSCMKKDLDEIRNRISSIEQWQKSVNSSIGSLQSLVVALESNDFITSVTPLADGSGYVINFLKSGAVTIKHGEKGDNGANGTDGITPIIGTKQDTDGKYYWTLNGEWLLNEGSKTPISAEDGAPGQDGADAIAPQVRISSVDEKWEISIDGGVTWSSTGVDATGDSIFAADGIDNTNGDYVELTLADGTTKIQIPRYKPLYIGTVGGNDAIEISGVGSTVIALTLPLEFKETDYTLIMAEVKSNKGTGADLQTRAATSPWSVKVKKPTFKYGQYNNDALVVVKAPIDIAVGEVALLEVTLVGNDGEKRVSSRALKIGEIITTYNAIGVGTEENPYQIINSVQLSHLAATVNNGNDMKDVYFKLVNDITLVDYSNWIPIGKDESTPFKGVFDGNNNKIYSMIISHGSSFDTSYKGLFGCLDNGALVYNISVNDSNISLPEHMSGDKYIGAIIGYLKDGRVGNLSSNAEIVVKSNKASTGNMYVGGAIGLSDIEFSSDMFNVNSRIKFNMDAVNNVSYRRVGRNIGWCVDQIMTKSSNNPYDNLDSSFEIIAGDGVAMYSIGYANGYNL